MCGVLFTVYFDATCWKRHGCNQLHSYVHNTTNNSQQQQHTYQWYSVGGGVVRGVEENDTASKGALAIWKYPAAEHIDVVGTGGGGCRRQVGYIGIYPPSCLARRVAYGTKPPRQLSSEESPPQRYQYSISIGSHTQQNYENLKKTMFFAFP